MTETPVAEAKLRKKVWRLTLWVFVVGTLLTLLGSWVLPWLDMLGEDRVALVRIEGVIVDSKETVGELKRFGDSPSVKAIVLRIDSPGGGVVPSQEIYEAVRRLRTRTNKAVVTSMGTVAASGGYYIAVASDRITTPRSASPAAEIQPKVPA